MALTDIVRQLVGGGNRPDPAIVERPIDPSPGPGPPNGGGSAATCPPGYTWTTFSGYGMNACVDPSGKVYTGDPICPSGMVWAPISGGYGNCVKSGSDGGVTPIVTESPQPPEPVPIDPGGLIPPGPGLGPGNCPPGQHWEVVGGAPGGGGCVPDATAPRGPVVPPTGGRPPTTTLPPRPTTPPNTGAGGPGVPFGATQFPLWVYTGDVTSDVHQVPQGPPGSPGANVPGADKWKYKDRPVGDVKPNPITGLCLDGSKPDASGNCPQTGKPPDASNCLTLICKDKSAPTWDGTKCVCADGSDPTPGGPPTSEANCAANYHCEDGSPALFGRGGSHPNTDACICAGGTDPIPNSPSQNLTSGTTYGGGGGGGGGGGMSLSDMVQQILSGQS